MRVRWQAWREGALASALKKKHKNARYVLFIVRKSYLYYDLI